MQWVVWALGLALAGCAIDLRAWWLARKRRMAECAHRWEYRSVDNLDRDYQRHCTDCPYHEAVPLEEVPHAERARRRGYRP